MMESRKNIKALFQSPLFILVLVIVGWFIATFLIFPNLILLLEVFRPDGQWSFGVWSKLASSERAMKSLANSFLLAFVLIFTVNVIGIFIVLVTRYFDIFGSRFLYLAYATSLVASLWPQATNSFMAQMDFLLTSQHSSIPTSTESGSQECSR